jgi:hypothetical protein
MLKIATQERPHITVFYRKYYYRKITAQGSRKTSSKNYVARLAQGPLQSLKALDPELHNPDFEALDPTNLQNHTKTGMYRFGPKNLAREERQRSLHNAGTLPAPPGGPEIARAVSRTWLAQDPRDICFSSPSPQLAWPPRPARARAPQRKRFVFRSWARINVGQFVCVPIVHSFCGTDLREYSKMSWVGLICGMGGKWGGAEKTKHVTEWFVRALFSSNSVSDMGVLDNVYVVHWLHFGRTRVHFGASAVVPPPELLAKSHVRGPT